MAVSLRRHSVAFALLCTCQFVGCEQPGSATSASNTGAGLAAVPELVRGLKLQEPSDRTRSAMTLGGMGPDAKDAVPALVAALKDRDPSVRAAAAYALGQIGPDARSALKDLEALTRQGAVRDVASKAIKQIAPSEGPAAKHRD